MNYAKDYMNDICGDLCETIQSSSESLVQNVKTWYSGTSSSPEKVPSQDCSPVVGGLTRYRRREVDFVIHSKNKNGKGMSTTV